MSVGAANGNGGGTSGGAAAGANGAGNGSANAAGTAAGGAGAGAAAASGGAAGAQGAAGSAGAAAPDWTTGFNDDFKGFVQTKGWKAPTDVVDSYRNLEKLVGVPPEQLIKLPKGDEDASAWEPIYNRLGRPATPDGYKLEVPKEGNPEFAKAMSDTFHKLGLSEKQGQEIAKGWNSFYKNAAEANSKELGAKLETERGALKKEWGAAFDQNMAIAKRAAREFGVTGDVVDAIEKSSGSYAATMKFFQTIGSKLGDASFHTGSPGSTEGGPMTPAQAMSEIKALRGDPAFTKKYVDRDTAAVAKMERLHKYAYPDAS